MVSSRLHEMYIINVIKFNIFYKIDKYINLPLIDLLLRQLGFILQSLPCCFHEQPKYLLLVFYLMVMFRNCSIKTIFYYFQKFMKQGIGTY